MSRRKARRVSLVVITGLMLGLVVAACGSSDDNGGGGDRGGTIAFCCPRPRPRATRPRTGRCSRPRVKELCPDCKVLYTNADQDAAKQQQQAEAALTNGAKVLVLDAVDAASAGAIVAQAKQRERPGRRLRPAASPDAASTTTSRSTTRKVGELQAQALVDKLKADGKPNGPIVMINGAPTDNNAKLFKQGAHEVLDSQRRQDRRKEYDTPDWSPDKAQKEMDQAITALGKNGFDGVYAANDGTAGGAIAAMKAAGINPSTRPMTGQDAELAGDPADPRRRAVHDGLQGRSSRRPRTPRRSPWSCAKGEDAGEPRTTTRSTTAPRTCRRIDPTTRSP